MNKRPVAVPARFLRAASAAACGLALIAGAIAMASPAAAQSCHGLWVERNSIYKEAGFCFKTERAISFFGNEGCRFESEEDLPLSPGERRRIAHIRALERDMDCR